MYVCICHGVTDRDIQRAANEGCRDMVGLTMRTGCGSTCGSCVLVAEAILEETHETMALPLQLFCQAA